MIKGPPPKPTAVLNARGSWRGKKRAPVETPAPSGLPVRPDWQDPDLLAVWDWLAEQLTTMKLLSSADQVSMEDYCRLVVMGRRCEDLDTLLKTVQAKQAFHDRYGLNPSARARMAITVSQLKADAPKLVSASEKYRGKKKGVA